MEGAGGKYSPPLVVGHVRDPRPQMSFESSPKLRSHPLEDFMAPEDDAMCRVCWGEMDEGTWFALVGQSSRAP